MLEIPPVVREKALAVGAGAWLDVLPELVAALEADWRIAVGPAFPFSTEAVVAEATLEDASPAVLKLIVPRDGEAAAREIAVLRLADGDGCARLLRADEGRGALLLERLGRPLSDLGLPAERRHEILVAAARQVWRHRPGSELPSGADKARSLARFVEAMWEELGRPCSRRVIDHALACAASREAAYRPDTAMLVHGVVHQWNALEAGGGSFKLVDPDGLAAEPEYDLGILMREDPLEPDLTERADRLAALTGLDARAIWEWGVVERVGTGLLGTRVGLEPVASEMLEAAERLAP